MTRLAEFGELLVLLTVHVSPVLLFVAGCDQLAKSFWARQAIRDEQRRTLYRKAEAIAEARLRGESLN